MCAIVTAVADALDYAHQRGLLHRDVKPANILLTEPEDGKRRILLADFGIARPLADISGLTATNFTVGTLAYAAPEQLMGADIDGRADQYALAATAFHLLTGSPPFQHSNPVAVISQHLNATPPKLSDRRPELAHLDQVLSKALAKDPADRFDRCREFAAKLSERADFDAESDRSLRRASRSTLPRAGTQTQVALLADPHRNSESAKQRLARQEAAATTDSAPSKEKRRRRRLILARGRDSSALCRRYRRHPLRGRARRTTPPLNGPAPASAVRYSTAPIAWTTTCKRRRQTARPTPNPTPTTPLGGRFVPRAHPPDALPQGPNWTTTTTKWRAHQLIQSISISPMVTGRPRRQSQMRQQHCLGANGTITAGVDTEMCTWSLEPQPDGTLRGVQTDTVLTNECGFQGTVTQTPFVATRIGDVPSGVTVADPATVTASPTTSTPAPAIAGPVLDGTFRVDYDDTDQTVNGTPTTGAPT